ncbi:MAG: hypothetical protein ABIK15_14935 [Pseudomonadota bacterium]
MNNNQELLHVVESHQFFKNRNLLYFSGTVTDFRLSKNLAIGKYNLQHLPYETMDDFFIESSIYMLGLCVRINAQASQGRPRHEAKMEAPQYTLKPV